MLKGLPRDESSEPNTRRNKHPGGDKFSLSDDLKASLPKVDKAVLSALRSFVNGKGQALPFTFFEKTFPKEAQDIVLKEMKRNKEVVREFQEIPSKEMADGSREYAFERKHLYGVMGILITTGLTKKPRIIDHWGVEAHDNYPLFRACMPRDLFILFYGRFFHLAPPTAHDNNPLVRACMPRDLFILFYGRFFHLAPPTGKLKKDDPQYDSKHHIRYAP
ncbi:unnamed protein product [Ectocarpus sp. CCAP 1310/34]|nr:unnamed protein product [Ectocarpus sp. CCAP 1310/34]